MAAARELVVDEIKVRKAIQLGLPLAITTFTLPHEIETYIEQVVAVFLKYLRVNILSAGHYIMSRFYGPVRIVFKRGKPVKKRHGSIAYEFVNAAAVIENRRSRKLQIVVEYMNERFRFPVQLFGHGREPAYIHK